MALTTCKECGGKVSDRATECPHCGCPMGQDSLQVQEIEGILTENQEGYFEPPKSRKWLWTTLAIMACAIGIGIYWFINKDHDSEGKDTALHAETSGGTIDLSEVEITQDFIDKLNQYPYFESYSEGRCAVVGSDGKWGYIDTKGDIVIPRKYTSCDNFKEGLAFVKDDNHAAFIDDKGNEIITLEKDAVATPFVNGHTVVYTAREVDNDYQIGKDIRVLNDKGEVVCTMPVTPDMQLIEMGEGVHPVRIPVLNDGFIVHMGYGNFKKFDFEGKFVCNIDNEQYNNIEDVSNLDYFVFAEERKNGDDLYAPSVMLRGIKDRNRNIVVPAKEWTFSDVYYDNKTNKNYINPSNGVFKVVLNEDPSYLKGVDYNDYSEGEGSDYCGFVDLKGNNTFSETRWERQKQQTYNILNNIQVTE